MKKIMQQMIVGHKKFREKYVLEENNLLTHLADKGQNPEILMVSCCDSRVDPALLLQCDPGDLFTVRNIANIIPPFENDESHHGTSAALEFGICYLHVKHLIILGHSQCGGIQALLNRNTLEQNDFISNWTDLIKINPQSTDTIDCCAKSSLLNSYKNALTFPWIKKRVEQKQLMISLWFFDIKEGCIYTYNDSTNQFEALITD